MLAAKEEKRELLHRKWEEQIAECESSNMPVREWCAVVYTGSERFSLKFPY